MTDDLNIRLVKVEQRLDSLCRELTEDKSESKRQYERICITLESLQKSADSQIGRWRIFFEHCM